MLGMLQFGPGGCLDVIVEGEVEDRKFRKLSARQDLVTH